MITFYKNLVYRGILYQYHLYVGVDLNFFKRRHRYFGETIFEFVFCLRGELEYQVERQVFNLQPGDSLLFAAHLKHKWKNPGRNVATAIIIISGFEEGEELHAMHWKKGE